MFDFLLLFLRSNAAETAITVAATAAAIAIDSIGRLNPGCTEDDGDKVGLGVSEG